MPGLGDDRGVPIAVEDPADPRIEEFLGLRDHELRRRREAPGGDLAGIFIAEGDLVLDHSTITHNSVAIASGGLTQSGGADVGGKLLMTYSTISDNAVSGISNNPGSFGGARVRGGSNI